LAALRITALVTSERRGFGESTRGLAEDLLATGAARISDLRLFGRVQLDLSRLPSRFPYLLITAQYNVERLLLEWAVEAGVEFVYDTEVVGLHQDDDGVRVDTRSGDAHHASYVVGTDRVRSGVRQALGLPFPGRSVLKSIMLADVQLDRAPAQAVTVNDVGDSFAFIAPFGDGWYRVFAWDRRNQVPDTAPLTLEEIADVTRRALGTDLGLNEARWMSRFHSDERQAPRYRVGRVFLAGVGDTDVTGFQDRVHTVAGNSPMLVRPDGYIAWHGNRPWT
jgi:2-polyprenyl-6-methoxyphenol hydroxylase-like FAD-dependent oxidoreductase